LRNPPPVPCSQGVAESLMSTRTTSAFIDKGVVSPEEFVIAGDFLVAQCPTWSWQGGDPKNARSYLPAEKQFLVTRNVPCMKRAAAMEEYAGRAVHSRSRGLADWLHGPRAGCHHLNGVLTAK
jgi:hypothetical protein